MQEYLFCWGYETPNQLRMNEANGWEDEDSMSVFITAESEQAAINWGREIAERFFCKLHNNEDISWKNHRYASCILDTADAQVHTVLRVSVGEMPDLDTMISRYNDVE